MLLTTGALSSPLSSVPPNTNNYMLNYEFFFLSKIIAWHKNFLANLFPAGSRRLLICVPPSTLQPTHQKICNSKKFPRFLPSPLCIPCPPRFFRFFLSFLSNLFFVTSSLCAAVFVWQRRTLAGPLERRSPPSPSTKGTGAFADRRHTPFSGGTLKN